MRTFATSLVALGAFMAVASAHAQTATAPTPAAAPAPAAASLNGMAVNSPPPMTEAPGAAPVAAPTEVPGAEKSDKAENGLISPNMRLGAMIGGGLSTRPVVINVMTRINRTFGVGAEYRFLPGLTFSDSSLTAYSIGADLRWFPAHGSFFLGTSLGYQSLSGSITQTTGGVAIPLAETLSSVYVTPRIGWLWTWDFGLALGLDLGVTIPIAPSVSGLGNGSLDDAMKVFGKMPIPEINSLRVGALL